MKGFLSLVFLAGALATVAPSELAAILQFNTQVTDIPQPQATTRASSHDRHHHRQGPTSRHHRRHKASAKHS